MNNAARYRRVLGEGKSQRHEVTDLWREPTLAFIAIYWKVLRRFINFMAPKVMLH